MVVPNFSHGNKKNYNRPGDLTREKRQSYIEENPPALGYAKIYNKAFPTLNETIREAFDPYDVRQREKIYYTPLEMILSTVTSYACNHASGREYDRFSSTPEFIENIGFLCGSKDLASVPHSSTINNFFANTNIEQFQKVQFETARQLIYSKRYLRHRAYLGKQTIGGAELSGEFYHLIIDAVHIGTFDECPFENCPRIKAGKVNEKGEETYVYLVTAVVAKLALSSDLCITLGYDFVINDPNSTKQDCEIKSAMRLLPTIKDEFPRLPILLGGDALYATRPILDLCAQYRWGFIGTLKDGAQPTICEVWNGLRDDPEEVERRMCLVGKDMVELLWCNDVHLLLDKEDANRPMSILQCEVKIEKDASGKMRVVRNHESRTKCGKRVKLPELSASPNMNFNNKGKGGKTSGAGSEMPAEGGADEANLTPEEKNNRDLLKAVEMATGIAEKEAGKGSFAGLSKECELYVKEDNGVQKITIVFRWLCNFTITKENARVAASFGRQRWRIESSFYIQKEVLFSITHLRSLNENGIKAHFACIQLADTFLQLFRLYDSGVHQYKPGLRELSKLLMESLRTKRLLEMEAEFKRPMKLFEKQLI